jgi:hypothetical protein
MYRIAFIISLVIISAHTVLGLSGSGTQENPWLIQSLEEFNDFVADANYWDDYTRLETDVNLAGQTYTTAVIAPDIYNYNTLFNGTAFTGVFDGNDHSIINLTIDGGANNDFLGLFGYIDGGEVRNLILDVGYVSGDYKVGGLVGENGGIVSHCYSTGTISGDFVGGLAGWNNNGDISNCYTTGSVSGDICGGLVGKNWLGSVWDCRSNSSVSGYWTVGGLVADNDYGYVQNCHSTGDVSGYDDVGGLLGHNTGYVSNCYSTGDISGELDVGGLMGEVRYGNVSNCYSIGSVTGGDYVGGLIGVNCISISNCYSIGDVKGLVVVGGLVGENYESLSNCCSAGNVSGTEHVGGLVGDNGLSANISNCNSTGNVGGDDRVGGLLGVNYGTVLNCYSTGDVSGDIDVGGLLGWNFYGNVSNCFWDTDTQTHGVTESIGLSEEGILTNVSGLATTEMQIRSTFTSAGWDFVDIWDLTCEGMNYPRFIWQITPADFLCPHGVNFRDYSFFAGYWGDTNCGDANDCDGADFDLSGKVDINDIDIFCGFWLNGVGG